MWWMLAAQVGMSALGAASQYSADKAANKAQRAWQQYSNTMLRLSDAVSQNAITTNQLLTQEGFANEALQIDKNSLFAQAKLEVSAAAAGVKGRSVNQAMFDVQRNAGAREYERQQSFKNANFAFDNQRLSSSMNAEMQQDRTYLPKPKAASYVLNAAAQVAGSQSFQGMFGGSGGSGGSGAGSTGLSNAGWSSFLARN